MQRFSLLLFVILFLTALSVPGRADEMSEFRMSLEQGDYLRADYLRTVLGKKLETIEDPLLRTGMKRALYLEHVSLPEDLIYDHAVSSMLADGDDLWLGSRSGDIARYSLSERRWTSFVRGQESLAIRAVQSIIVQGEHVWFLSYGSVGVYSKRQNRFFSLDIPDRKEYRGLQSAIVEGRGLICGTQSSGLRRIRLDGQSLIRQEPPLENITFLQRQSDGRVLAGSEEQGLFVLDRLFRASPVVQNSRLTAAARAVLGTVSEMIVGTYGGGIVRLKREERGYRTIISDYSSRWITDGVELPGLYCFSTLGQGLLVLGRDDSEKRYYGIEDGLSALDISAVEYASPFLICAVQEQGLNIIHEKFFKTP